MARNVTNPALQRKLISASVLALLTISGAASANQLADIKARGELVCGTLATTEPLGFTDAKTRKIVGFDVDICQGLADQLGVKMVQKSLSVEARIPELQIGRVDVLSAALGYTAEREKQIDFSSSHFQVPLKVLAPVAAGYKTLADLDGKRVGMTSGSTSEYWLRKSFPKIGVVTYHDSPSGFLALEQRKINGLAFAQTSGMRYLQAGKGKYAFIDQAISWEPNALGIKKNEPELLAAVNGALEKMEQDGQLEAIWNKWMGSETVYKIKREHKLEPIEQVRSSVK
ncbi:transporter substrate-binding domain-containing protein [Erwiniaceae bacterium BAC15a-03b]|uniref:Transporter substrate-binding domain-containing protein n=1 Tax=Winslowiella arboricola TaxID=2978220 RepID=A0A9J6PTL0_9GAMM|nr:transporter substrate-binding domain-containing protein [Winslowiella arboricola]MCU5772499.1 transporter substrate-binding domain-containing protein [Winslowiella arboricola]MCU5779021.1 transporter substrate-binding domain-containing protein [Winslowiella arboricola]